VYACYFDQIFGSIEVAIQTWTRYSPEQRLLETLLLEAGPFIGSRLDKVMPVFKVLANTNNEFEIREGYVFRLSTIESLRLITTLG
jgi:hypothetical protein